METQRIASYRREFSALADLQAAGTVTYSLLREADAFVICVQRDEEPPVERMLCDTGEERAGMLTRFLYENAVEPDQMPAILRDICGWAVGGDGRGIDGQGCRAGQTPGNTGRCGTFCVRLPP